MSSPVSLGYLLPDSSRIRVDPPVIQCGGRPVATRLVPDWHYLTDISVEWAIQADLKGLIEDCGLTWDADVGALLVWRSERTNLQGAGQVVRMEQGQNILVTSLPGRNLGGTVTIEVRVVLLETDSQADEFAPSRSGSLLWHVEQRIALEGSGGRFPTVATEFSPTAPGGQYGVWYLEVTDRDLEASATEALRLYINTAAESIRNMLDRPSAETSTVMMRFLRYDTARQLLNVALSHDEFDDRAKYGHGTLGDVLASLIRVYLPGRSVDQLRAEYPLNSAEVDAEILAAAWRDS